MKKGKSICKDMIKSYIDVLSGRNNLQTEIYKYLLQHGEHFTKVIHSKDITIVNQ